MTGWNKVRHGALTVRFRLGFVQVGWLVFVVHRPSWFVDARTGDVRVFGKVSLRCQLHLDLRHLELVFLHRTGVRKECVVMQGALNNPRENVQVLLVLLTTNRSHKDDRTNQI